MLSRVNRCRHALAILLLCAAPGPLAAAPVRVSFLDTEAAREDTLSVFARAGCDTNHLAALRQAITHYYRTPLALDTSAFPPATDGFREFASIGDFVAALGTNRLSFLDHPFELNCFDTALLLAGPEMDVKMDLHSCNGPFLAVQVTTNLNHWLIPVSFAPRRPCHRVSGLVRSLRGESIPSGFHRETQAILSSSTSTSPFLSGHVIGHHCDRDAGGSPAALASLRHLAFRAASPSSCSTGPAPTTIWSFPTTWALLKNNNGWLYLEKTGGKGLLQSTSRIPPTSPLTFQP